jgi:hypothetical protein
MDLKRVLESSHELYNIAFDENLSFQFRLLSIKEYNLINKMLTGGTIPPFFIYEEIFNICFLGRVEFISNSIPFGYIVSTGELIYTLSGKKKIDDFLLEIAEERKEHPTDSIFEHMKCVIFAAFPSINLKILENMTEKEFIRNFVAAENTLSKTKPEFVRMDLASIYNEIKGIKPEPKVQVKSERVFDAGSVEKELGYWETKEAEERFLKEEIQRVRLSKEDLKKLDKRNT